MPIGNLEYLRRKNDMTLEEVGLRTGTSKQYIHMMEKGKQKVSNKFKIKFAELYGMTVEEFEKLIS